MDEQAEALALGRMLGVVVADGGALVAAELDPPVELVVGADDVVELAELVEGDEQAAGGGELEMAFELLAALGAVVVDEVDAGDGAGPEAVEQGGSLVVGGAYRVVGGEGRVGCRDSGRVGA